MTQALYSAASGIRSNQTRLNVISNNIANVNTLGFKSSNVNFATVFSQTFGGGTSPTGTLGGTNPKQMGNGVFVQEIASNFSQGGTQFTGRNTDVMINGEGFFVVERVDNNIGATNANGFFLTRAGNFSLDSQGNLVTASGNRIRGTSQVSGDAPATRGLIQIPQQMLVRKDLNASGTLLRPHIGAVSSTAAQMAVDAAAGTTSFTTATVRLVSFTVGSDGGITATYSNGDRLAVRTDQDTVTANPTNPSLWRRELVYYPAEGGTFGSDLDASGTPSYGTDTGLMRMNTNVFNQTNPATVVAWGDAVNQGMNMNIQSATVVNPAGLTYEGSNNFLPGANSGTTNFGIPNSENRGGLQAGALETSNVDLTNEFTNLIVTQRGLEASSRMIRAQSEVLQTVINMV